MSWSCQLVLFKMIIIKIEDRQYCHVLHSHNGSNLTIDGVLASCFADFDHYLTHFTRTTMKWFSEWIFSDENELFPVKLTARFLSHSYCTTLEERSIPADAHKRLCYHQEHSKNGPSLPLVVFISLMIDCLFPMVYWPVVQFQNRNATRAACYAVRMPSTERHCCVPIFWGGVFEEAAQSTPWIILSCLQLRFKTAKYFTMRFHFSNIYFDIQHILIHSNQYTRYFSSTMLQNDKNFYYDRCYKFVGKVSPTQPFQSNKISYLY